MRATATSGVVCSFGGVVRSTDGVVVVISPSQLSNFSNDGGPGRVARMLFRCSAVLLANLLARVATEPAPRTIA